MISISETPRLGAHHAICLPKRRNPRLSSARVRKLVSEGALDGVKIERILGAAGSIGIRQTLEKARRRKAYTRNRRRARR